MRGLVLATGLAVAALLAVSASATRDSNSVLVRIAPPAAGQAQVSLVTVQVTTSDPRHVGTLQVVGTNTAQLGTAKANTQLVVAVSAPASHGKTAVFKVFVFMHHFPPARRFVSSQELEIPALALRDTDDHVQAEKLVSVVKDLSCPVLQKSGFFGDPKGVDYVNLVLAFDTKAEAQVDAAVFAKCSSSTPSPEDPNGPGEGNSDG